MAEQVKSKSSARLLYQVNLFLAETGGVLTDISRKGDDYRTFKFVHLSRFFKTGRMYATERLVSEIEEMAAYCFGKWSSGLE